MFSYKDVSETGLQRRIPVKKGCIIVLAILILLMVGLGVAAGVAYYKADEQFGLSEAPMISHEDFAVKQTHIRARLLPEKLQDLIIAKVPAEKLNLPSGMPADMEKIVSFVLPHEAALVTTTDYRKGAFEWTLFINERRGGPFLVQIINEQGLVKRLEQLDIAMSWDAVVLEDRGKIVAKGRMSIPEGLENRVLEDFLPDIPETPILIEGDHLLEIAFDNRNGEALTLMGTVADAMGDDWQRFFTEQYAGMALGILPNLHYARLTADLDGFDTLKIKLRIAAQEIAGPNLAFLANMGIPYLKNQLESEYNLILDGDAQWVPEDEEFVGNFTLRGIEPIIDTQLARLF
jgi:hypothetical protein